MTYMIFFEAEHFCKNFEILVFINNLTWRHFNEMDVVERCSGVVMCTQALNLHRILGVTQLNGPLKKYYNNTLDFNDLQDVKVTIETGKTEYKHQHAILVSSSGADDVHVFGVKSDKGTTDGYMALPLTLQSTEFFIASWK